MNHYFKLVGQPVYFGYYNGRTVRIDTAPIGITIYPFRESVDYQLFHSGSPLYEAIGAEAFSEILTGINQVVQSVVETQLSMSIIK
jgi:hypothetical protein